MSRTDFSTSKLFADSATVHVALLVLFSICSSMALNGGTVAHYKFERPDGDAPLYELTDSSGRGHHGMVVGQQMFELTSDVPRYPGLNSTALDARGHSDLAVIPHHSDFAPAGDWTIEFFIKVGFAHHEWGGATNVAGPNYGSINDNLSYTILAKQNTNQPTRFGSAWAFHYQPEKGWVVFTISYGSDKGQTMITGDLRDNKWHHIAIVYRTSIENELRMYVDGFSGNSANQHGGNIPISWGDGPILVGAWAPQDRVSNVPDRNFDGMLDEIRFSDVALSTETFVVDFSPYLFPPIPVETYGATEVEFEAAAGKFYRIEVTTPAGRVLGYVLGEGAGASFFHRGNLAASTIEVREIESGAAVVFGTFNAVEVRFPTEPGQLYRIFSTESLGSYEGDEDFVVGDGGKLSYFDRVRGEERFYSVERY